MRDNPFTLETTQQLARRILADGSADDAKRIWHAYELLFGRPPSDAEINIGQRLLGQSLADTGSRAGANAWAEYCQVLLCANEFVYVD